MPHSVLASLLQEVKVDAGGTPSSLQYLVRPVPSYQDHYFGRTNAGAPCLLLNTKEGTLKTPIRLAGIDVGFAVPCLISTGKNDERTETLTAITCIASDHVVQDYFLHVCETILQIVGTSPSLEEVVEAVQKLVDLFQRLSTPARRSVIGLFGELYVIHVSTSPPDAVAAWRSATDDRFDFSVDDVRIEVKTSGSRDRSHEFSLEQCSPPPDTDGVLVSLFAEASGGGLSLRDLVERIEQQLMGDPELILKLQENIADGLGDNLLSALSRRFDEDVARSSIQVYELTAIPAIRDHIPPEISRVRFRSDLSYTPAADIATLASRNAKLKNLLPR